ncbi:CRISPR-associated helicase Cas3' [Amycolatopsis sp. NPDC004169]|uniref:CRISPR-associated helicase Cas3' n=1 Tax=Amycolatopsis sp. NPDC004169 TaxID=3154453 RepID=UPI0033AD6313
MSDVWLPWGKSAKQAGCHPLICHMLDTAAVAERMAPLLLRGRVRSELAATFGGLGDAWGWVVFLCAVHDLGKYSPTFQALNLPLSSARLGPWAIRDLKFVAKPHGVPRRVDTPHGLLTALHLQELLASWGASQRTAIMIAAALGGHHGHFPAGEVVAQARREINAHGERVWAEQRTSMVAGLALLRGLPDPRTLDWAQVDLSVPAAVGLAALTTVSDWIASDTSNFAFAEDEVDLVAYAKAAAVQADAAVDRLKMSPWAPPGGARFEELFGQSPRSVQEVVERVTAGLDGPALVVVEAPTGEGKTKAALQATAALVPRLGLAGSYFGMPTQATSNQMLAVMQGMLTRLGDPTTVSLVHSAAREVLAEPTEVGMDEPGTLDAEAQAWFTRKRNLLSVLGCGTIDQALKGAFRSGHVFVRLAGLANKVVVFDEVHAYDTYMSTLLQRLLMWLGALGVPVVLLSATLPASRRAELIAAWQAGHRGCYLQEIDVPSASEPYPRVTVADAAGVVDHPVEISELNRDRVVHLEQVPDEGVVDWLLEQAAQDRCVAVVHNLVRRATETYAELERRIKELPAEDRPLLLAINGTLPTGARRRVEQELQGFFGEHGMRPRRAIVVGTQAIEQSLDLDFDGLITDLAPIDLVFQRAGRVHRHRRGAERGRLTVAITGVVDTPTGPEFPAYLRTVYAPIVLMRTWAALKDLDRIDSWTTMAQLVEEVYGDQVACPPGWEAEWRRESDRLTVVQHNDREAAAESYLPQPHLVETLSDLTERPRALRTRKSTGRKR